MEWAAIVVISFMIALILVLIGMECYYRGWSKGFNDAAEICHGKGWREIGRLDRGTTGSDS